MRYRLMTPLSAVLLIAASATFGNPYHRSLDEGRLGEVRGLNKMVSKLSCASCASLSSVANQKDACLCKDQAGIIDGVPCTKCEVNNYSVTLRQGHVEGDPGWVNDDPATINCSGDRWDGECAAGACGKLVLHGVCKKDTNLDLKKKQ
jgi:hypothetical protein